MRRYLNLSLVLVPVCLLALGVFFLTASAEDNIRPPAAAGTFYPDSESELRGMITTFLEKIPDEKPEGEIIAAMAPHAGYIYSGEVAAHAFKQLADLDFDTMVIIGHDSYENCVAFLSPDNYFRTPLGLVPVDRDMVEKIIKFNKGIISNRSVQSQDHSIEIQLPFLQVLGKRCKIVPVMFGNPTAKNCRILADAIMAASGGKKVFVLSSTDLSHYPSYEDAQKVDNATFDILKTMDLDRLFKHLEEQVHNREVPDLQTAMCSRGGVGTAMLVAKARGADQAQVLKYANSGDAPEGSKKKVVGYSSVLFVRSRSSASK